MVIKVLHLTRLIHVCGKTDGFSVACTVLQRCADTLQNVYTNPEQPQGLSEHTCSPGASLSRKHLCKLLKIPSRTKRYLTHRSLTQSPRCKHTQCPGGRVGRQLYLKKWKKKEGESLTTEPHPARIQWKNERQREGKRAKTQRTKTIKTRQAE